MPGHLPPIETRFAPGQSGNPGGRPKVPEDVKEARKLNRVEFDRIANRFLFSDRDQVKAAIEAPGCPMIEIMVGKLMLKAIDGGDPVRLGFLLDRIIGKPKETIEIEGNLRGNLPTPQEAMRILSADWALQPSAPVRVPDLEAE